MSANPSQTIVSRTPLAFLLAMYDRRVSSVEDVSSHLSPKIISRASNGTTPLFARLFDIYLQRYMHGVGHPPELRGSVECLDLSDDNFDSSAQDPLLRAHLVLGATGDYEMLPIEDDWAIEVSSFTAIASGRSHPTFWQVNFHGRTPSVSVVSRPFSFH